MVRGINGGARPAQPFADLFDDLVGARQQRLRHVTPSGFVTFVVPTSAKVPDLPRSPLASRRSGNRLTPADRCYARGIFRPRPYRHRLANPAINSAKLDGSGISSATSCVSVAPLPPDIVKRFVAM